MTSNMKIEMITTFHHEDIAGKRTHLLYLQAAVAGTATEAALE